jgi:hypothetical protein
MGIAASIGFGLINKFLSKGEKQRQQQSEKDIYGAISAAQEHKAFVTRAGEQPKLYPNVFTPYGKLRPTDAQNISKSIHANLLRRFPDASEHVANKIKPVKFKDPEPIGRTSFEEAQNRKKVSVFD